MNNFGTLTFVLSALTDSDSEAEVHSIRICKRKQKNIQSSSEDVFLIRRSSASVSSEELPKKHLKTLRQEVLKNESQPLKILLLIKCLKILKPEVLLNVSRFQGLEVLKIAAKRELFLIEHQVEFKWIRSQKRKYKRSANSTSD